MVTVRSAGTQTFAPQKISTTLGPLAVLLLVVVVWFVSLGTRSLIHSDEGRYASLALAMAQTGDWITPRLNGLLYFEKPAFQYWMGAISFQLFGINEFAARLWPGLSGFLTIVAVGFTARRLWGVDAGLRALAIALGTTWIIGNSHYLTLDAGLTFFLTLTLCAVLLAGAHVPVHEDSIRAQRRWMWLAWAAMAGAVLSKGLVGIVIPGAVLVITSVWRRDFSLWRGMHWGSGLLIFFALAAPWFVLVSMRNPGFAQFFFIHEHFTRFLTKAHHREGAWWYYVPLLLGGLLPWTSSLPWIGRSGKVDVAVAQGRISARDLLVVWCVFVFVFFSVSGSKLPSYILPMFPALALLLALQLRDVSAQVLRRHLWVPTVLWLVALAVSTQFARYASKNTPIEVLAPLGMSVRVGAVCFLCGAAIAWWCLGRRKITMAIVSLAVGHFLATTVVLNAHDSFGQLKSSAPIARALLPLIKPQTPVFAVRDYDQTLPFYLQRNVVLVDYEDEFQLGESLEPGRIIPTMDEWMERWRSLDHAAAYMGRATWVELQQRGLPMRVVYQDPRRVMVVKP